MKTLFVFFAVIFCTCNTNAQWTQCPLYGGVVRTIAIKDTFIFAGMVNGGGIFASNDYSVNWFPSDSGISQNWPYHVNCMAVSGDLIYACTDNGYVYRSADNGSFWTLTYSPFSSSGFWKMLVVDTLIFGACPDGGGGVFLSVDSGSTWAQLNNGLDGKSPFSIAYDNSFLFVSTDTGVYRSSDLGASWAYCSNGLPTGPSGGVYDEIVANDTVVYVCMNGWYSGNKVFKSIDKGISWSQCGDFGSNFIKDIVFFSDKVYIGADYGVYYSYYNSIWTPIYNGITNTSVTTLIKSGNDLFAGTKDGVYFLAQDSTKWVKASNGMTGFTFHNMANINNNLIVSSRQSGFYKTTDHGDTWSQKNFGFSGLSVWALAANQSTFYAGNDNGIYRSNNYGNLWQMMTNTGFPAYRMPTDIIGYEQNLFVSSFEGLIMTHNNGTSWSNSAIPSTGILSLAVNSKKEIFAIAWDEGIYMSKNDGLTWTKISHNTTASIITACDTTLLLAQNWNPPMVISNDYGNTWNVGSNGLFGHSISSLKTIGNYVFAGLNDGLYFTKDKGNEWNDLTQNLPVADVICIGRDDSCLYACVSGNGIWKRPLADFNIDFSSTDNNQATSDIFIFPNPATNILYISSEENATVEILNLQGKSLSKSNIPANGSLDVSALKSGVYLVRIKTDNGVVIRKFVKQ